MRPEPSQDKFFYLLGWGCISLTLVYMLLKNLFHIDMMEYAPLCAFNRITGLYCPGCGGTRAIFAFFRGDILKSFFYHPFVPYALLIGGWFMITQTIERISREKVKIAMHFRMIYAWIGLAIIAINFLWKNGVLLITGNALMG